MLLAVNLSNSSIEFGLLEGEKIAFCETVYADTHRSAAEYAVLFRQIFQLNVLDPKEIDSAILSSVVPSLTYTLRQAVKLFCGITPMCVGPGMKTGLKLKVEDPKAIGADLIASAVAAVSLYGTPLIVVGMQTATVFSVIDSEKQFLGGSVIPGLEVSLQALSDAAAQLPEIGVSVPKKVIQSKTVEAMQSGIVYGQAAMLDGMIERIEEESGLKCTVVATGRMARVIIPFCKREILLDNQLILKGLGILYHRNITG